MPIIRHRALDRELRHPVGIDRLLRVVFIHGQRNRVAIGAADRGEHQPSHPHRAHGPQEIERSYDIVDVILRRVLHRLADVTARGEMHHGIDAPPFERPSGIGPALQISLDEVCTAYGIPMPGGKIV